MGAPPNASRAANHERVPRTARAHFSRRPSLCPTSPFPGRGGSKVGMEGKNREVRDSQETETSTNLKACPFRSRHWKSASWGLRGSRKRAGNKGDRESGKGAQKKSYRMRERKVGMGEEDNWEEASFSERQLSASPLAIPLLISRYLSICRKPTQPGAGR